MLTQSESKSPASNQCSDFNYSSHANATLEHQEHSRSGSSRPGSSQRVIVEESAPCHVTHYFQSAYCYPNGEWHETYLLNCYQRSLNWEKLAAVVQCTSHLPCCCSHSPCLVWRDYIPQFDSQCLWLAIMTHSSKSRPICKFWWQNGSLWADQESDWRPALSFLNSAPTSWTISRSPFLSLPTVIGNSQNPLSLTKLWVSYQAVTDFHAFCPGYRRKPIWCLTCCPSTWSSFCPYSPPDCCPQAPPPCYNLKQPPRKHLLCACC